MSPIQMEDLRGSTRIFQYSGFLNEIESLRSSDKGELDISSLPERSSLYGFYFSPQCWKTLILEGKTYFLPQGGVLLVKPGEVFQIETSSETGGNTFFLEINSHLKGLPEENTLGFNKSERTSLFERMLKRKSPVLIVSNHVDYLLEQIVHLSFNITQKKTDNLICLKLKNLFRELWIYLAEGEGVLSNMLDSRIDSLLPKLPEGGYSSLVDNAINQMGENLTGELTLVHLADKANISLSRFKVRFKEETGIFPLEYYTRLSIQKAMLMLFETKKPITEIADELGYSSTGYFSTVFKNTAGLTPGELRKSKRDT
jgi:AraC-like DNA-binding protein